MSLSRRTALVLPGLAFAARAAGYDPLTVEPKRTPRRLELSVNDRARERSIPLLVTFPDDRSPAPVLLFSHGLGGSRHNNKYLSDHWSARGFLCVFVQHPGSDESVWKEAAPARRLAAMREAASMRNFQLRVKDIPAVLDTLAAWNRERGHPLEARLDLRRIGMSGHSFGAVTTQAVSGQRFGVLGAAFTDERIRAAVAFSPSAPRRGSATSAFGSVSIPWMLMTGTRDVAIIGDADLESRLAVFPALPPGSKYELVLHNAEHSAFSESALPGDRAARNPNHHRAILALSTAFWDATLWMDPHAREWLDGEQVRGILEAPDRWQRK